MEDNDSDRRDIDRKRFKFDAGINIAHILTTLAMVFALFNWGSGVNSAIAIQNVEIQNIKSDRTRERGETLQALLEINRKLDHISEASHIKK